LRGEFLRLRCLSLLPVLGLAQGEDVAMKGVALVLRLGSLTGSGRRRRRCRRLGLLLRLLLAILAFVFLVAILVFAFLLLRLVLILLTLLALFPFGLDLRDFSRVQPGFLRLFRYTRRKARVAEVGIAGVEEVDSVLGRQTGRGRLIADEA
jgi:hypothetical protein